MSVTASAVFPRMFSLSKPLNKPNTKWIIHFAPFQCQKCWVKSIHIYSRFFHILARQLVELCLPSHAFSFNNFGKFSRKTSLILGFYIFAFLAHCTNLAVIYTIVIDVYEICKNCRNKIKRRMILAVHHCWTMASKKTMNEWSFI